MLPQPAFPKPWPFSPLPAGKAGVVLVDPPWSFKTYSTKGWGKSAHARYECQDLSWVQALPVRELCAPDAVCVLWATAPMLPQAIKTLAAWGFTYKTAGAWAKQSKTGKKVQFGTGFLYRSAAEFWVLGTIGKPRILARDVRNLILAPVREHSRKPDEMRINLQHLFPGPYVELFARPPVAVGWGAWGNALPGGVVLQDELEAAE